MHFTAYIQTNYVKKLNSKLVVDSWSNFELLISLCADEILSDEQKEKYTISRYNKVLNVLPEECRVKSVMKELESIKEKSFIRSSITNKYNSIYAIFGGNYDASRVINDDKIFLELFGKLRNGVHNNFIYFGTDKTYTFQDKTIVFENNEPITFTPNADDILLRLSVELNNIADALISSIEHRDLIFDPSINITLD